MSEIIDTIGLYDMDSLIPKRQMLTKKWNGFDKYPKNGSDIVLHISAYHIRGNKNSHDFIPIKQFNAISFCMRDYVPPMTGVSWQFSWLPMEELKKAD